MVHTMTMQVRTHAVTTFSPLEAAICFQVFGTQRYTIINRESFSRSARSLPLSMQILTRDDGTIGVWAMPCPARRAYTHRRALPLLCAATIMNPFLSRRQTLTRSCWATGRARGCASRG
jgi:hypothetical protein